jgi:hypothetical protein
VPIDYRLYPADWPERRARVLERAKGRGDVACCEQCGAAQYAVGYRDEAGRFVPNGGNGPCDASGEGRTWPSLEPITYAEAIAIRDVNMSHVDERGRACDPDGRRYIVIVLTTAHLDRTGPPGPHDGPLDCPDERLAALCQACHIRLDVPRHAAKAAQTRRARKACADLFDAA